MFGMWFLLVSAKLWSAWIAHKNLSQLSLFWKSYGLCKNFLFYFVKIWLKFYQISVLCGSLLNREKMRTIDKETWMCFQFEIWIFDELYEEMKKWRKFFLINKEVKTKIYFLNLFGLFNYWTNIFQSLKGESVVNI